MPNERLLGLDPEDLPLPLTPSGWEVNEGKGFTPTDSAGIVIPTDTPSSPLSPRQAAKLKRIQEAAEARMKREKVQHDQLHSAGSDYSGREQIMNLMRKFGRA